MFTSSVIASNGNWWPMNKFTWNSTCKEHQMRGSMTIPYFTTSRFWLCAANLNTPNRTGIFFDRHSESADTRITLGDILFVRVTSNNSKHNASTYGSWLSDNDQSKKPQLVALAPSSPLAKSLVPMARGPNSQQKAESDHLLSYSISKDKNAGSDLDFLKSFLK